MVKNTAFFGAHERWFLEAKALHGEESALCIMTRVMSINLGAAYNKMNPKKGDPYDFVRVVGERDRSVGLRVEFPEVSENRIVYRFIDDPFENLKGHVEPEKLDATYMKFKVDFLLGLDWSYRTAKHMWKGDGYTEHVIEKSMSQ